MERSKVNPWEGCFWAFSALRRLDLLLAGRGWGVPQESQAARRSEFQSYAEECPWLYELAGMSPEDSTQAIARLTRWPCGRAGRAGVRGWMCARWLHVCMFVCVCVSLSVCMCFRWYLVVVRKHGSQEESHPFWGVPLLFQANPNVPELVMF